MFQPTHPKSRAQKELRTVELQLLDWEAQLEMARCNVDMLNTRARRLERYVKNYDNADTMPTVTVPQFSTSIPQAF